jgi:hypothetical protein
MAAIEDDYCSECHRPKIPATNCVCSKEQVKFYLYRHNTGAVVINDHRHGYWNHIQGGKKQKRRQSR